MNIESLRPEQIEQIFKLCEMACIQDFTLSASILAINGWKINKAISTFLAPENCHGRKYQSRYEKSSKKEAHNQRVNPKYHDQHQDQDQFGLAYCSQQQSVDHQITKTQKINIQHSSTIAIQNFQYEEKQRKMIEKRQIQLNKQQIQRQRQEQLSKGRKQFEERNIVDPLPIKFRLMLGTKQPTISFGDKVQMLFKYVNCYLIDYF